MRWLLVAGSVAIVAIAIVGIVAIGTDEETTPDLAPPPETADLVPPLPPRWTTTANAEGGFALGVPPDWSAKNSAATTTLRSPGNIAVVRVTSDRSQSAINSELGDFASILLENLGAEGAPPAQTGEATGLETGAGYEVASAMGEGQPADGEARRLQVVVVRRPELAAFPLLIASAASVKPRDLDPIVEELVASLRGQPVASL